MVFSGIQMKTWTLLVFLSWMFWKCSAAKPHYMVAIPAVLESGAETTFCASLMEPNETLVMDVTLMSQDANNTLLLTYTSNQDFHLCTTFKAPVVQRETEKIFKVEVRGDTFYSTDDKRVMIRVFHPITFVQTDKPIYLPGQTVHFRVITLDLKLRPADLLYKVIEIKDPHNNRIGQWLNESSNYTLLQHSYILNSEAREGLYKIVVTRHDNPVYYNFKVKKYVLPKFELTLKAPNGVNIMQEEFEVEACAMYTYGQSVPANVEANICRNLERHTISKVDVMVPCQKEKKQTNNKGCAIFTFKMSDFLSRADKVLQDKLDIKVKAEEEGTGVSSMKDKSIQMSFIMGTLSFIDTPTVYNRGSVVEGKVKAVHYNNTPIPNMLVYLSEDQRGSVLLVQNLTTNSDGTAAFSLNTTLFGDRIHLYVTNTPKPERNLYRTPHYQKGSHALSIYQIPSPDTKTVSSLQVKQKDTPFPCNSEQEIFIHYDIVGETRETVDIMYLVLTGKVIVMSGLKNVEIKDKSVTSFTLWVSPDMVPGIHVVAYAVLPSETVIAHHATFRTEKCFSHKVSLELSPSPAVPGEEVNMQVSAQPHSLCGVAAVDRSVLIQDRGNVLDEEKIFNIISARKSAYTSRTAQDPVQCLRVRTRRRIWVPDNRDDTAKVFLGAGLKMATNLVIATPTCLKYRDEKYIIDRLFGFGSQRRAFSGRMSSPPRMEFAPPRLGANFEPSPPETVETVRTYFPETWIWDLVGVGDSGRKDVSLKVPDTITTWETEAFCLSPQGFGLAPRQKLTVFQPFFLELTLPYSIIRGENVELKATTFNYLSSCLMITVTPAASSDYTLNPLHGDQVTFCLCGSERRTLRWTLVPSTLGTVNVSVSAEAVASHLSCDNEIVSVPERGRVDVVTRSLIVKAEGTEMTKTHNVLLCPKGDSLREDIALQLPVNVIEGSARASVSVLGDILGRALKNLERMLRMPYGCGEQNMALLAPNIYILQYLKGTQQLTPAILEKVTNFLTSGYQRQLNYKHANGAYSTFGSGSGNTWLTAFVLRTFAKAQSFIYIDPSHVDKSTWLESKQKENGCFEQSGKLFNNRMKGGVSDEVTLSAYITAAYLEINRPVNDYLVKKGLSCLKESLSDLNNTYTTALLAYVFTLAGDMETRGRLLQHLDTVAIRQGGFLHWSQKATETSASLSVEISSYVLLAKLSSSPTAEDLGYTSSIVRWLTGQQNYYGGFSSTQDTVVALQALALYSTLVFSPVGSSTVVVQTPSGQQMFEVNPDNKLLYQEAGVLQDVAGKYSIEVMGSACAAVQISLHYNIPTPRDVSSLTVEVTPKANCIVNSHQPTLSLQLRSLHSGEQNTTNMVILDIKVLSGFVPDSESLKMLRGALLVDRVDHKEDHVLVYLRELLKDEAVTHTLDLVQEVPVQNLKPAVVKIYDYYQPSDQAETEYIYPCAAAADQQ